MPSTSANPVLFKIEPPLWHKTCECEGNGEELTMTGTVSLAPSSTELTREALFVKRMKIDLIIHIGASSALMYSDYLFSIIGK